MFLCTIFVVTLISFFFTQIKTITKRHGKYFCSGAETEPNFLRWNETKTDMKNLPYQHRGSLPSGAVCGVEREWCGNK